MVLPLFAIATELLLFLSLLKFLPQARWMGGIVLDARQDHAVGFHADSHEGEPLLGRVGRSLTDLRPAGIVELEGRRLDVVTAGGYIERGVLVKVIEIKGNRVVVERTETGEA